MHTAGPIGYTPLRLAIAVAAALGALSGCGSSGAASVRPARPTGLPDGGTEAPPAAPPTSAVSTPATPPPILGNDPHGVACSALSIAEIEQATGLTVLRLVSNNNPARAGDSYCDWHLAPAGDFAGAFVSVQLDAPPVLTRALYEQQYANDVKAGKATAMPGLANSELGGRTGLFGTVSFVEHTWIVTVSARLRYTWDQVDTPVLLNLAPLVATFLRNSKP
jgi:hypothetical protein